MSLRADVMNGLTHPNELRNLAKAYVQSRKALQNYLGVNRLDVIDTVAMAMYSPEAPKVVKAKRGGDLIRLKKDGSPAKRPSPKPGFRAKLADKGKVQADLPIDVALQGILTSTPMHCREILAVLQSRNFLFTSGDPYEYVSTRLGKLYRRGIVRRVSPGRYASQA